MVLHHLLSDNATTADIDPQSTATAAYVKKSTGQSCGEDVEFILLRPEPLQKKEKQLLVI